MSESVNDHEDNSNPRSLMRRLLQADSKAVVSLAAAGGHLEFTGRQNYFN